MRHIPVQAAPWRSSLQAVASARVGVQYSSKREAVRAAKAPHRLAPGRGGSPALKPSIPLGMIVSGVRLLMFAVVGPAVRLVLLPVLVVILEGAEGGADVRQDRVARNGIQRAEPRAVRRREPLRCVDAQCDVARRAAELEAPLVLQLRLQRRGKREGLRVDRALDQDGSPVVYQVLEFGRRGGCDVMDLELQLVVS